MPQLATFDTHKYIKELTATGFDERWAEVIIKSILEGKDYNLSNLATKEQLIKTEVKLEKQIVATSEQLANVKAELENTKTILENKIENTKRELKKDIGILDNKIDITKQELKKDIENTKKELKQEIELKTSQLETKIEKSKNTIVMWMITMLSPIYIGILVVLVGWLMKG